MELWDIVVFLHMAIARQLNLEALTVNAPPPPLMYPLPGGFIMDDHRRKRRDGRVGRGEGSTPGSRSVDYGKSSARFSMKRSFAHSGVFSKASVSLWDWQTPLWLQKLHHLLGSAVYGLVSDYVYHQPTIVLVWVFIVLIFLHFFMWLNNEIPIGLHDPRLAAAAIMGWLFLVRGAPHRV